MLQSIFSDSMKDAHKNNPLIKKYHYKPLLSDTLKLEFCKSLKYKLFERGERIYKHGDEEGKMYIILRGTVAVTFPT